MTRNLGKKRLSAGEMEVLQLLWDRGELTLSEAHQAMDRKLGYTTVQTRLNRLVEKGLVARSEERPARYSAAVGRQQVSAGHLDLLIERVTAGKVVPLVAQLIRDRTLSPDEIHELKQLIDEAEASQQEGSP